MVFGRRKAAALVGEFLGTGILTITILSVQRSQIGLPFFVAIATGMAFALLGYVYGGASGGYFNPAITLALWTARKISTVTGLAYIIVQFAGAYAAFGIFTYLLNQHLPNVGGHYTGRILVAEALGTAVLSFGFASTVYQGFSKAANSSYAGLAYAVGILVATAGSASLGLLNPAVALGAKSWVWGTYVLGPVLGAIIGTNLYALLFAEPEALATSSVAVSSSSVSSVSAKKPVAKRATAKKKTSRKK